MYSKSLNNAHLHVVVEMVVTKTWGIAAGYNESRLSYHVVDNVVYLHAVSSPGTE